MIGNVSSTGQFPLQTSAAVPAGAASATSAQDELKQIRQRVQELQKDGLSRRDIFSTIKNEFAKSGAFHRTKDPRPDVPVSKQESSTTKYAGPLPVATAPNRTKGKGIAEAPIEPIEPLTATSTPGTGGVIGRDPLPGPTSATSTVGTTRSGVQDPVPVPTATSPTVAAGFDISAYFKNAATMNPDLTQLLAASESATE